MNEGSFGNGSGNTAPYSLAEIWQFPQALNGGGGGLGLRRPQFGNGLGQFGDFATGPNRDGPGAGLVGADQRAVSNSRKRRESTEEESAKRVSTSNGGANGVVFAYSLYLSSFNYYYIWN